MHCRLLLPIALLCGVVSTPGSAQSDECNTVDLPGVEEQYQRVGEMVYIQGPFLVRCSSGAELRADQGTVNQASNEILLVGNVYFRDPTRTLTAQQATYTRPIRRLYATGDVVFADRAEGTTIRGPELEYFAVMPGRPEAQVNAGQRPHLTLMPEDSTGGKPDPLEIDADRMTIIGRSNLSAYGSVVIQRTDLDARAEEARYDGAAESLELRRSASVQSKENTLRGELIEAKLVSNKLEDVRARNQAVLEARDLVITAPDVHLFFREELVERTVARSNRDEPGERPVARSPTFRLVADSIDALAPAQRVERVIAIGKARGETIDTTGAPAPDTASAATPAPQPGLGEEDWIVGDTIIGYFAHADSTAGESADTSAVLERVVALGAAQSLYRVEKEPAGDAPLAAAPAGRPRRGINYVSAASISLRFRDGEVDVTEVGGLSRGLYLDPAPPAAATPPATPEEGTSAAPPAAGS